MRAADALLVPLVAVLLGFADVAAQRGPVTLDMIRDSMMTVGRVMIDTGDKLERHEYRERQLGEQVKKSLATLIKKTSSSDQALGSIGSAMAQMEAWMRTAEEAARQRDERNLERMEKLMERLEKMELWQKAVEELVRSENKVRDSSEEQQDEVLVRVATTVDRIERAILSTQQQLACGQSALADEQWKSRVSEALFSLSGQLQTCYAASCDERLQLAVIAERLANNTMDRLEELRAEFIDIIYKSTVVLGGKVGEVRETVIDAKQEVLRGFAEGNQMLYTGVTSSYDQLRSEVQSLAKIEQVLIQTADNVLDTKRRIEYGIHQILVEVGEVIKVQVQDLNNTFNRRFDDISATILDNQTGALANLSSKIEQEISQVWRQIGTMYNQLIASTVTLDRLQRQTEEYVNVSLNTMDGMEGKVGQITNVMRIVDDNLNFLMGRLSFVSGEFNNIKIKLGDALNNIKDTFLEAQEKIKEIKPARVPIPESEVTEDNNLSLSDAMF